MAVTIFKGSDGKEYFNLTAQSGTVTTSNDPEDFWPKEGTINFPFHFHNAATLKLEKYLADAIVSSAAGDINDVTIHGLDEDNNPMVETVTLTGTTEVKLKNGFWRVNDIKANVSPFEGNISMYNAERGSGTVYAYAVAAERETKMGLYSPSKTLFIQKIELLSGSEDVISNIIINKYIPSDETGETLTKALTGIRTNIKYIQFEKPGGQVQPCNCFEFKNPHRISVGESFFITVEEVTGNNVIRCNIEGYFE